MARRGLLPPTGRPDRRSCDLKLKEAELSGVIYAVLVIVWACVLVPMWVRRNDGETEDIVSSPSRILPRRRLPVEQRPATRPVDAPGPAADVAAAAAPAAPLRPLSPAERRQRLFIGVCVLAGLPALLFVAGVVPAGMAVLGALPLAGYGALRYAARHPKRAGTRPARPAAPMRSGRPAPRTADGLAAPVNARRVAARPAAATASEPVFDREQYEEPTPAPAPTWSPVPVPLPTYLSSRRGLAAPRRRSPAAPTAPATPVGEARPAPRRAVND